MTDNDSNNEINFDHLNTYVAGDVDLTAELFSLFQHQVEMWGRALVVDTDDETWESVTHSLKGTANAVGALDLADLCRKAEGYTGERNRAGLREKAIQDIEFSISRTVAEIQRWEYKQKMNALRGAIPNSS